MDENDFSGFSPLRDKIPSHHHAQSPTSTSMRSHASFSRLHSLDLLNIEYEDILSLYRGFRRAEGLLNEKTKEADELHKINHNINEAFQKTSDKLKALELLRDSTATFESQFDQLREQNEKLIEENNQLSALNIQLEEQLLQKTTQEENISNMLNESYSQIDLLQNKYDELVMNQTNTIERQHQNKDFENSFQTKIKEYEEQNQQLVTENHNLQCKYDHVKEKLHVCDTSIVMASEQLFQLSNEIALLNQQDHQHEKSTHETAILKRDCARLLKLLENYPEANGFLDHWRDSQGMSYIGALNYTTTTTTTMTRQQRIENDQSTISNIQQRYNNRQSNNSHDYPIPHTLQEELFNWVPTQIVHDTKVAHDQALRNVPYDTLLEYLKQMNMLWMKREKLKVKRIKQLYRTQIIEYKRQLSNARSYRNIMTEREVKRLKTQVLHTRTRLLQGKPSNKSRFSRLSTFSGFSSSASIGRISARTNSLFANTLDLFGQQQKGSMQNISVNNESDSVNSHLYAMNAHRTFDSNLHRQVSANDVTASSLLQASLLALPPRAKKSQCTLARQKYNTVYSSQPSIFRSVDLNNTLVEDQQFPTEMFLSGALWLGKNVLVYLEKLYEEIETIQSSHDMMRSTSQYQVKTDPNNQIIHDMVEVIYAFMLKMKVYLRNLAAVDPGDKYSFNKVNFEPPLGMKSPSVGLRESSQNYNISPNSLSSSPILRGTSQTTSPNFLPPSLLESHRSFLR